MFSCKICKTCDNNYSKEHLRTTASSITHVLQLAMFSSHFVIGLFNEVHYSIIRNQYVSLFGMRYSRIDQVKLSKPSDIKYFNGCLPQILLGPFLNTLSHLVPVLLALTSSLFPILYSIGITDTKWVKRERLNGFNINKLVTCSSYFIKPKDIYLRLKLRS